ncbi:MAG: CPBP family intramembrane metalloprotease [Ignavibacteria bacterium]|jgi:membrane protease YdiL (CAAX protease family)
MYEQEPFEPQDEFQPALSPKAAAFIGLIGIFFLYQIGGSLLTISIFGFDLENADINALRLLQAAGQLLLILLPTLLLAKYIYHDVSTMIRYKIPELKEAGLFALGMIIVIPMLQSYLFIQTYLFEKLAESVTFVNSLKTVLDKLDEFVESTYEFLLGYDNVFEMVLIVFMVSVIPAICEEVLFRGFVQKSFELVKKPAWAIIVTSLFFGLYHFNPYGLVALVFLGMYFGYAAYKSSSILIPILLHFINNFFTLIAYFIFGEEDIIESNISDPSGIITQLFVFILLLLLFSLLIYYIRNYYKTKTNIAGGSDDLSEV